MYDELREEHEFEDLEYDMEFEDDYEFDDYDDEDEEFFAFYEDEDEDYFFDEEGDEFWGKLKSLGKKAWSAAKKVAKKVAPIAKAHAGKIGTLIGGAVGGPAGAAIGGKIGGFVKNLEDEDDGFDSEDEMNATIQIPSDDEDMAEAMAAAAVRSRPADAQALGGALAVTIMSRTPLTVKAVSPAIANATGRVAKAMAADRRARPLIAVLPSVVKDTTAALNRKAAKGKPITPRTAARVMTKQAKRTLRSTPRLTKALAGNAVKRRRLNRKAIARAEKFY